MVNEKAMVKAQARDLGQFAASSERLAECFRAMAQAGRELQAVLRSIRERRRSV